MEEPMPDTAATPPWHVDLTNSIRTLGAAADEMRTAHANARHTARAVDPARLTPVPGLVTTGSDEFVRPHDEALWQLTDLYAAVEQRTQELYENAALAYAQGAAQALTAVLRAQHPHHVDLTRDADGRYALTGELPDLDGSLTTAAGGPQLATLRARVLTASEPDTDDAELTTDLADAAHAYGKQAEATLTHLIHFAADHGLINAS
jgi:hypothetical protein